MVPKPGFSATILDWHQSHSVRSPKNLAPGRTGPPGKSLARETRSGFRTTTPWRGRSWIGMNPAVRIPFRGQCRGWFGPIARYAWIFRKRMRGTFQHLRSRTRITPRFVNWPYGWFRRVAHHSGGVDVSLAYGQRAFSSRVRRSGNSDETAGSIADRNISEGLPDANGERYSSMLVSFTVLLDAEGNLLRNISMRAEVSVPFCSIGNPLE